MSNYDDFPVQSEFRSRFLSELEIKDALAELAMKGGQLTIDDIEVEIELNNDASLTRKWDGVFEGTEQ